MNIKLDIREKGLINEIKNSEKYNISIEQLPLGDIIIEKNNEEIIIIERKTLNDLVSSIKDGRYKEQSLRLANTDIPNHNIIYLIEGNLNCFKPTKNMSIETIYSSFVSLMYFKGFSVFRTFNIKESAAYIVNLTNKINKENKTPYYQINNDNNNNINNNIPYTNVIKKVKKDNITVENIDIIMLSQIPDVSINIATNILNKYKSLTNLIKCLQENDNCLHNFEINIDNNKKRKISKKSIQNICTYLMKKDLLINMELEMESEMDIETTPM
tara:strand:- start:1545 stop:2357 length:813 start_codon:yes stop_codon:yes gene_type:complete